MTDTTLPLVSPADALRDIIRAIDRGGKGIAIVVDGERRLLGTITDGDVRRAMLSSATNLDNVAAAEQLLKRKAESYVVPTVARYGTPADELLELMQQKVIKQIPLLDENDRVVSLATIDELLPLQPMAVRAVVMAGGFGSRLMPLTEELPKPMLPVAGRPLMERIINQLRDAGIHRVNVTTHYRPDKIRDHFGDGKAFGVDLEYVNEEKPLGTAGALGLIGAQTEPLLVINGDILTQVDFRAMISYHQEHNAQMTVAVRRYEVAVPYGVIECDDGATVRRVSEKPRLGFLVNAGIYLIEPSACSEVPNGQRFEMTDLIEKLVSGGKTVVSFPVREYWLDIGQLEHYQQAQIDYAEKSQ